MKEVLDVVGVGAGPFNLSVAALLHPIEEVTSKFFEQQSSYSWHPGMLLPNVSIQNSFLKDLVSSPTRQAGSRFLRSCTRGSVSTSMSMPDSCVHRALNSTSISNGLRQVCLPLNGDIASMAWNGMIPAR